MRLINSGGVAAGLIAFSLLNRRGGLSLAGRDRGLVGLPLQRVHDHGGMGPVGPPPATVAAKLFGSFYAFTRGDAAGSVGVLLTPGVHRLLHRFHVLDGEGGEGEE